MKTTSFILALALLTSCGSQFGKTEKQTGGAQDDPKEKVPVECYEYAQQGDTVTLHLVRFGNMFTGALYYKFKEKDINVGTFKGTMENDVLVADYTFRSESTQSVRQVAFKKAGNTFVEGYGESVDVNGITRFKNVESLDFNSSIKLEPTQCQ